MGAHVSPHPEPVSHLPPGPIPLGCPRAPALSALLHGSNLHWSSILPMVICVFHCCSLRSSHLCLLPQSPKVCSLHLCETDYLKSPILYDKKNNKNKKDGSLGDTLLVQLSNSTYLEASTGASATKTSQWKFWLVGRIWGHVGGNGALSQSGNKRRWCDHRPETLQSQGVPCWKETLKAGAPFQYS